MSKNTGKILSAFRTLAGDSCEIKSGKVVAGSIDETNGTISVLPTDGDAPIEGVLLKAHSVSGNGILQIPKDDTDVVISSIDGPGEWVALLISEPEQVSVKIDNVECLITANEVTIANGNVAFVLTPEVIKMTTPTESLHAVLNDLITAITSLTVGTSTGPSTVPINVASFTALQARLSNLTSA